MADAARDGRLLFGTVDSWLIWNLTGKEAHVTDVTNASRTMLMNIETLQWDDSLCKYVDVKYKNRYALIFLSNFQIFPYTKVDTS